MNHFDRVKETTTTTGSGAITLLGAASQFVSFTSKFSVNEFLEYAIVGQTTTEWETGLGQLANATTLNRVQVFASSNANALVVFSAGTKDVFNTLSQSYVNKVTTYGQTISIAQGVPTL